MEDIPARCRFLHWLTGIYAKQHARVTSCAWRSRALPALASRVFGLQAQDPEPLPERGPGGGKGCRSPLPTAATNGAQAERFGAPGQEHPGREAGPQSLSVDP